MVASRLILVATDNHETHNTCFLFIAVTALWAICRSKNSTNATPLLSLVSLSLRMVTLTEKTNKQTNAKRYVNNNRKERRIMMYMYLIYRRAIYVKLLNWILPQATETLRSDDGDRNENVTKEIGLITKTTTLHVHHAFLYISLPSLHDYEVKMPNFTLYRGRTQATTKFPPSLCTCIWFLGIQR